MKTETGKLKGKKKVKKTSAKKTSAKKPATKKKAKKKTDTNCNLWVMNSDGIMELISIKIKYRMGFVHRFGTVNLPFKREFDLWYDALTSDECVHRT